MRGFFRICGTFPFTLPLEGESPTERARISHDCVPKLPVPVAAGRCQKWSGRLAPTSPSPSAGRTPRGRRVHAAIDFTVGGAMLSKASHFASHFIAFGSGLVLMGSLAMHEACWAMTPYLPRQAVIKRLLLEGFFRREILIPKGVGTCVFTILIPPLTTGSYIPYRGTAANHEK